MCAVVGITPASATRQAYRPRLRENNGKSSGKITPSKLVLYFFLFFFFVWGVPKKDHTDHTLNF